MKLKGLLAEGGWKKVKVGGGQDPMIFVSRMVSCVAEHKRSSSPVVCEYLCPMMISKWEEHRRIASRYLLGTIARIESTITHFQMRGRIHGGSSGMPSAQPSPYDH